MEENDIKLSTPLKRRPKGWFGGGLAEKRLEERKRRQKKAMRKKWTYKILKGGELQRPSREEQIEGLFAKKKNSNRQKKISSRRNKDPWSGTKVSCSLWTVKKK